MARRYIRKPEKPDENIFWTTMSDMFLGLMMVFMILFVFAMTGYSEIQAQAQRTQQKIAKNLDVKLKQVNIDADVDLLTGQVNIPEMALFSIGSYELTPKGKEFFNKFFPVYVSTIYSNPTFADRILNIQIQGHSDSQTFKDAKTKEQQFIKNLDLSTKRAIAVESYIKGK